MWRVRDLNGRCRVLGFLVLLAACRGDDSSGDDVAPDASEEVGCAATDPRTPATQVFVGPTGLEQRLEQFIDGAQTSLDVQMYLFTIEELADRIIAADQRGVDVRVILDPDHDGNTEVRAALQAAGVPWVNAPSGFEFSHAKYLIRDGEDAIIMSANLNYGAVDNERNYGTVISDPDDVADLQAIFESDYTGQGFADLDCTRLVVSPVNARMRVLQLINAAESTLDLSVIYLSDSSVRSAVIMAADRGADVRVLLGDPGAFPDNVDTATTFANQGIPVRYVASSVFLHAKLIISDGVALVGSHNLSSTSLTENREVGVLVTEAAAVSTIQAQLDQDWNGGTDAN